MTLATTIVCTDYAGLVLLVLHVVLLVLLDAVLDIVPEMGLLLPGGDDG